MKSLIVFQISKSCSMQVVIDEHDKINTYGYRTKGLHIFDEVEVQYFGNGETIILARDVVQHVIATFSAVLEKTLRNELSLDESLSIGRVGCSFSKKMYIGVDESEQKDDIFPEYWVWSSSDNIQTWLYNVNNKIYLEISSTYPWLFTDPEEGESYISFDEYVDDYKPIALVELQQSLVQAWINECHILLQKMETV